MWYRVPEIIMDVLVTGKYEIPSRNNYVRVRGNHRGINLLEYILVGEWCLDSY
jgi:hypothetical protein